MANITSKKALCQVMELNYLRNLIDENAELNELKIISIQESSMGDQDVKKLFMKAKRIQSDDADYDKGMSDKNKIINILSKYNLQNPINAYVIATTGKGEINTALQNNMTAFSHAEQNAQFLIPASEEKYAIFIDVDAKKELQKFFQTEKLINTSSLVIAESDTADFLNATQKIEEAIESDPVLRFTILTETIEKISETCGSLTGLSNREHLKNLQYLLKTVRLGTVKAKSDYEELSENSDAIKKSLEDHIEILKKNEQELLVDSEQIEEDYKKDIGERDDKIKELCKKLEETDSSEVSDKLETQIKNLESVKTRLQNEHSKYQSKINDLKASLKRAEDRLIKVETSKQKMETAYNEQVQKNDDLNSKLKSSGLTAEQINQSLCELPETLVIKSTDDTKESKVLNFEDDFVNHNSTMHDLNGSLPKEEIVKKQSRNIICKLSNFGLNTWNPQTTDLQVHMDTALKAGEEALQVGAAKTSVRRMILNSLGEKYRYVEGFLKDVSKSDSSIADFTYEIAKILGKKPSTQMHDFLSAQRKSGEDLLAYFARLCRLYKASANFNDDKWEQDPSHTMSIYSKIYESCYSEQKSEFIRKTENSLGKRTLTLPELRSTLIDVNQVSARKMNSEEPEINNLNDKSSYKFKGKGKPRTFEKKSWTEYKDKEQSKSAQNNYEKKSDCWYCGKTGHYRANCYRYLRNKGEKIASPREPETNGIRR